MKNIDFETLKKRREKVLALRTKTEEKQHMSICYELILDGKSYLVMACFPVGAESQKATDKFKYLINGEKS